MRDQPTIITLPMVSVLLLAAYAGMMLALGATTSPFVALSFRLDQASVARLFGMAGCGSLLAMVAARWADKVGRKRVLLPACLVCHAATLAIAFSPNVWVYAGLLVLIGASAGTIYTICVVLTYRYLPARQQSRGRSLLGIARAVGGGGALGLVAIATALGGNWRWAWGICCYPILLHGFFSRHVRETDSIDSQAHPEERGATARGTRPYTTIRLMAFMALWASAASAIVQWLYYHCIVDLGLSEIDVTILIGGTGLVSFVGFYLAERLAARFGNARTVALCSILSMGAGMTFYGIRSADGLFAMLMLAASLVVEVGFSNATLSTFQSLVNDNCPARSLASVHGLLLFIAGLFSILAQIALAELFGVFGETTSPIILMASLKIAACAVMLTSSGKAATPTTREPSEAVKSNAA